MITSLPPLTTSVGWRIDFKYSNDFCRGAPHSLIASIWAGATFSLTSGSRFSARRRKRFRNSRPAARSSLASRGHAFATARAGADQHQLADEVGRLKRDFLRDKAADRKAEHIDFRQSQRLDERHRVGAHFLDPGGHVARGTGYTGVVEQDDFAVLGETVGYY